MNTPISDPVFTAGRHTCEVDLAISDEAEFRYHFGIAPGASDALASEKLAQHLFTPFSDEPFGATLQEVNAVLSGATILATLDVDITDPRLFNEKIAEIGRLSGFDSDWQPNDAGEAIFESWCGCNDTPSPADIGLEICDWRNGGQRPGSPDSETIDEEVDLAP